MSGRLCEAYPAAALRAWGMASSGYKGAKRVEARRALVGDVTGACAGFADLASTVLEGCSDDNLDAFICALVARAVLLGLTKVPNEKQHEAAMREGWIHVPVTDPASIIKGTRPSFE